MSIGLHVQLCSGSQNSHKDTDFGSTSIKFAGKVRLPCAADGDDLARRVQRLTQHLQPAKVAEHRSHLNASNTSQVDSSALASRLPAGDQRRAMAHQAPT